MKRAALLLLSSCLMASCARGPEFPDGPVIDLTHSFDETTIYWPTEEGFRLERRAEGMTEQGYFYFANRFETAEHGGTHIDAPKHFSIRGQTVDEIPLERLMGQAVLVDLSAKCDHDHDYQIQIDDFLSWERQNGRIPEEAIVLLRTGFGRYWPDRVRYMGTEERGGAAVKKLHFPGLHPDAARWLVESRSVKAVGIDTPSIDYGQSNLFESHVVLFERNVPAFENLANLERLPAKDFIVMGLPMKIKGGSGGPTRVAAVLEK